LNIFFDFYFQSFPFYKYFLPIYFSKADIFYHLDKYTEYDSVGAIEVQNERLKSEIDFSTFNLNQLAMIRKRLKMLTYIDRLNTYEELNGGLNTEEAKRKYKTPFFTKVQTSVQNFTP